jgi:hypothetical protein
MLGGMDVDELQRALGAIVLESAHLERTLRAAFSALVGSKYAAVIDGRWAAAALIEDCEQITKHHASIAESARQTLLTALNACREANRQRNRVVHDAWALRPGDVVVTLPGDRKSHDVTLRAQTVAEVRQLAGHVSDAADELTAAMTSAFGPDWMLLEDALRQELGHDIHTDPGS